MRGARLLAVAAAAALGGCAAVHGAPANAPVETAHEEPQLDGPTHVVAAGETLRGIARAYGVSADALARLNGVGDPARLAVGRVLLLPDGARARAEDGRPAAIAPQAKLAWPLAGVLYAKFGRRGETVHEGIDLAAPEGTPVRAAADGRVLFAGEQRGYGHIVILEHADGLITLYADAGEVAVREGAAVRAGEEIARLGGPSSTSGPHLHFEVREGRTPRDPLRYLPEPR